MKPSRSEFITVRNLQYHIRHWGSDGAPKLFMLHGWMDVSASFQFLVDALQRDWHVIAPDWRGFGRTDFAETGYWHPDYLADLEAVLQHYSPQQPVNLLGHSLGANIAGIYAGVRPQRIARLVLLEGFGMPATRPDDAPKRYATWLDELQNPPGLRAYASQADVAMRLQKNNPRLNDVHAVFLAGHWAAPDCSGNWVLQADPQHRLTNPTLYRVEEIMACWREITASVLWVEAKNSELVPRFGPPEIARTEIDRRIAHIADVTILMVDDAGHMVQHDQPETLACAIENFLA
ncbi:MAG TPA: alpha/beta hydrolase [Oxalicibacterium sp.]|uniref:alpha/beta fold hydrolase n=1 Tax=Oxalicibacterium sp. TaxID=2766525 RepID=UPI002CE019DC|nr:alpha/beta hydrolase [Oxalicibacterium sp.]HWU98109.1 alpha/beta hydrolase [Oxalicibacterium sp.]